MESDAKSNFTRCDRIAIDDSDNDNDGVDCRRFTSERDTIPLAARPSEPSGRPPVSSRAPAEATNDEVVEVIDIESSDEDDDTTIICPATAQLRRELTQWLRDDDPRLSTPTRYVLREHNVWTGLLYHACREPSAKARAVDHLLADLADVRWRLERQVEVSRAAATKAEEERSRLSRVIFDASPYQDATEGNLDSEACWSYYECVVRGREHKRIRRLQSERARQQHRIDELQTHQAGVASIQRELEHTRARVVGASVVNGIGVDEALQTWIATVASDVDAYSAAVFRSWWGGNATHRRVLITEMAGFWRGLRFWLPSCVRVLVADELKALAMELPEAAALELTLAIRALAWTEELFTA